MPYSKSLVQKKIWPVQVYRFLVRAGAALMVTVGLIGSSPAGADALDGNAVRDIALQGTWAAENNWGYWTWSGDGAVCVRVLEPEGDCADTGTWTVSGEALCYEFTWFGEGDGVRKNCFTVHPLGDGRFDTRYHGGALDSTFFKFKVIE